MRSPSTFLITGRLASTSSSDWPRGRRPASKSRRRSFRSGGSSSRIEVRRVFLPGRRLDVDGKSVRAGGEEEIAALSDLEGAPLLWAQVENLLQLGGFAWALGAEKKDSGIGRDDRALIG